MIPFSLSGRCLYVWLQLYQVSFWHLIVLFWVCSVYTVARSGSIVAQFWLETECVVFDKSEGEYLMNICSMMKLLFQIKLEWGKSHKFVYFWGEYPNHWSII